MLLNLLAISRWAWLQRCLSWYHTHPEQLTVTRFDVVFAHELEAAVLANAEHRQTGRDQARPAAVSDRQSFDVRGYEKAPARIDMKIAAVDAARVDVLDDLGFAARPIDREHRERVLAADKNAALVGRGGAVCDIGKPPARMQLDRADRLPAADIAALGECVLLEHRRAEQPAVVSLEHAQTVVPFQRNIDAEVDRVRIKMARRKSIPLIRNV